MISRVSSHRLIISTMLADKDNAHCLSIILYSSILSTPFYL
jgi:hypothetical protein